jgi:hypothetical protein
VVTEASRAIRTAIALVAVVAAVAACGRYYWSKPGGSLDEFNRDSAACAREASPQYQILIEETYRACLRARGWVRAQQAQPAPGWYRGIE